MDSFFDISIGEIPFGEDVALAAEQPKRAIARAGALKWVFKAGAVAVCSIMPLVVVPGVSCAAESSGYDRPSKPRGPRMTDAMQRRAEWARAMLKPAQVEDEPSDLPPDPDYGL